MLLMGRTPAASKRARHPVRRRLDGDVGDRQRVAAARGIVDRHADRAGAGRSARPPAAGFSGLSNATAASRLEPVHAEAVGAVGGDLEVDHLAFDALDRESAAGQRAARPQPGRRARRRTHEAS